MGRSRRFPEALDILVIRWIVRSDGSDTSNENVPDVLARHSTFPLIPRQYSQ